jgi:hypothetical protein
MDFIIIFFIGLLLYSFIMNISYSSANDNNGYHPDLDEDIDNKIIVPPKGGTGEV